MYVRQAATLAPLARAQIHRRVATDPFAHTAAKLLSPVRDCAGLAYSGATAEFQSVTSIAFSCFVRLEGCYGKTL
jgi:hypothetical protein